MSHLSAYGCQFSVRTCTLGQVFSTGRSAKLRRRLYSCLQADKSLLLLVLPTNDMRNEGTRKLVLPPKCALCTMVAAVRLLSNGTGAGEHGPFGQFPASK